MDLLVLAEQAATPEQRLLGVLRWVIAALREPPFFRKPVSGEKRRLVPSRVPWQEPESCAVASRVSSVSAQYNPVLGETHFAANEAGGWLLVEQVTTDSERSRQRVPGILCTHDFHCTLPFMFSISAFRVPRASCPNRQLFAA